MSANHADSTFGRRSRCAVSGEVPAEPVVSKKSGALFEKRLALKYIADNGTDPTTGEPMTADDLLELKTSPAARPRPPTATSIPALLTSLQSEWDAAMLEVFELRKQYKQVRQELTAALYHNDAAARVVARLTRERDEARAALANVQQTLGAAMPAAGDGMDVDKVAPRAAEGIPEDVLEKMTEVSTRWVPSWP